MSRLRYNKNNNFITVCRKPANASRPRPIRRRRAHLAHIPSSAAVHGVCKRRIELDVKFGNLPNILVFPQPEIIASAPDGSAKFTIILGRTEDRLGPSSCPVFRLGDTTWIIAIV